MTSSGNPSGSMSVSDSRIAKTTATDSANRRRAASASVWAEARSSH